jgi:plastocyanin
MKGIFRIEWPIRQCLHCFFVLSSCIGFPLYMLFFCISPTVEASKSQIITIQINGPARSPGFFPDFLTIHVNDTVAFVNKALPANDYSVVAVDGSFTSPPIASNQRWLIKFTSPGTHEYRSLATSTQMVGQLLVVDTSVILLPTPNPLIEATVLAAIKNRQPLAETPVLSQLKPRVTTTSSGTSSFFLVLPLIIFGIASPVLLVFLLIFYRRYQLQMMALAKEDAEPPFGMVSLERLHHFFSKAGPWNNATRQQITSRLLARLQTLFHKEDEDEEDSRQQQIPSGLHARLQTIFHREEEEDL